MPQGGWILMQCAQQPWVGLRSRLAGLVIVVALIFGVPQATASRTQQAIFQDDTNLLYNTAPTLQRLRLLGADTVRFSIRWDTIAPSPHAKKRPKHFDPTNPADYPAANWTIYDTIVKQAAAAGISLNFDIAGGTPVWAEGPGAPKNEGHPVWEPSAKEYNLFVRAVGTRYSGSYNPVTNTVDPGNSDDLPRVSLWSVWNEPDYGPSLAPQGLPGQLKVEHSPEMYRELVDAAWSALHATGHGRDTFLFGELAPRGYPFFGVFSGMKPLIFIRAMYCVDRHYKPLQGKAAALRGCPTTKRGSARFKSAHPALFQASGVSDHPYSRWYPPTVETVRDPDYTSLAVVGNLTRALDKVNAVYHSRKRFPIWNTEYGYITNPPKHLVQKTPWVSASTAATYLNWAEWVSYKNPRIQSFEQFLLNDPMPALKTNDWGGFASGLLAYNGSQKPAYSAWRLPLYLPVTRSSQNQASLEVWGCARPVHYALLDRPSDVETIDVQFAPQGTTNFATIQTIAINDPHGYFDTHVKFPGSGSVRLAWTYPADDALLAPGFTAYSRTVTISLG
jgi:hypothetical protein